MIKRNAFKYLLYILGFPIHLITLLFYRSKQKNDTYSSILEEVKASFIASGVENEWSNEYKEQYIRKQAFFNRQVKEQEMNEEIKRLMEEKLSKRVFEKANEISKQKGVRQLTYDTYFQSLLEKPFFLLLTFIPGILMYLLLIIYSNPYVQFIFERLIMSVFVIAGVSILVFTILYLSPFDSAANLLGEAATKEQIAAFNQMHGLDLPYLSQLWNALKGIATFNLGASFTGNEDVATSIANKFPITLIIAVFSLLMAVVIAIPVGIISATRQNSFLDYSFMFIALIGLSIPNFWQGLIFILNFSIKLQWLPATYSPQNWLSIIMPVIVLGTGLTASVARMTRSSMLEIINEDYIITAKAKGLNERQVLWKHAVGNAMIPIITVIGLLFGGMLGGAAVTEKVFNISGIGSYIVDKQFIPDIPAIMGGVIYIAITISLVNVLIDILYAFFDPRIRSKMKQL
ncbi:ABC transporter permease [Psychrobacillus sp. OK032]|uniref:ABC transporter permease n=1 Tax=Psychrobacillus sp. OK032 TaxID=1884358 RepID=UPI000B87FD41|nr:ABC transporter permease [Psychrobacillus sp. OK032]